MDYDLANYQISLKEDFNLMDFLKESTGSFSSPPLNIDNVGLIAQNLMQKMEDSGQSASLEEFLQQAIFLLQSKNKLDALYESEQLMSSYDELKLQLLKLSMIH